MKKFTDRVLEDVSNNNYIIKANIEIIVNANSEGEAGYLADDILNGIEEMDAYNILNIELTEKSIK